LLREERSSRRRLRVAQEWEPALTRFSNQFFQSHLLRGEEYQPILRSEFSAWTESTSTGTLEDAPDVIVVTSPAAEAALRLRLGDRYRPMAELGTTHYRAWVAWSADHVERRLARR